MKKTAPEVDPKVELVQKVLNDLEKGFKQLPLAKGNPEVRRKLHEFVENIDKMLDKLEGMIENDE